jgi:hypothetical protein
LAEALEHCFGSIKDRLVRIGDVYLPATAIPLGNVEAKHPRQLAVDVKDGR